MKKILLILTLQLICSVPANAFVFYEDTKIWNQDSITFYFSDGSDQQKSEVKRFAKLWQRYIGIKFKYTNNKPTFFSFKKYYTITFKGSSNQSTKGAVNGTIHLGDLSDNSIFRKTTILHEFGHMLGLGHEHQRKDRPLALNNSSLINDCIQNQNQPGTWCKENLTNITDTEVFIESEYDSSSIMHYALKNIVGGNKKLLNTLPNDNSNTLSYTDKYYIAMLYNQNISDATLEKMHQQDLWNQQKFENAENKKREQAILNLSTSSCKTLETNTQTIDGKFCESGFMIIGKDNYSFPDAEFKNCHNSFKEIKEKINQHSYCQLSSSQLTKKRQQWSNHFSNFGQCQRLETLKKNNQEYFCRDGFSFVTKFNDMIGEKTVCYGSKEATYQAMKLNPVCNLDNQELSRYQAKVEKTTENKMTTKFCQVVIKKYKYVNCPTDFDYTIINKEIESEPINNKCFSSKFQAITAMNNMPFCQS